MKPIVIVSGCPGSGKTTLARRLAAADPSGLHLVSDTFYEFISHPVDPSLPESRHQNQVVMRALARSVLTFSEGDYSVFLDGVIGPWFLPAFREVLEPGAEAHYIVLQLPEAEALARVRGRQGAGVSPIVSRMVPQFAELGALGHCAVGTSGCDPDEVCERVGARLAAGDFRLDWSLVAPAS